MKGIFELLFLVLIGAAVTGSIVLIRKGRKTRRAGLVAAGVALAVPAFPLAVLGVWSVAVDLGTDWNPEISSDAEAGGSWVNSGTVLELDAVTHRVVLATPQSQVRGTWSRQDWNLTLELEGQPAKKREMRFHRTWGKLRLNDATGGGEMPHPLSGFHRL